MQLTLEQFKLALVSERFSEAEIWQFLMDIEIDLENLEELIALLHRYSPVNFSMLSLGLALKNTPSLLDNHDDF